MSNVDKQNLYGDSMDKEKDTGGTGSDIASQRQDELDTASLYYIKKISDQNKRISVLDLGGGFGTHSIKMAGCGANVFMVDHSEIAMAKAKSNFLGAINEGKVGADSLQLMQEDFSKLTNDDLPNNVDVLYSQRAIHYVPFNVAQDLLSRISNHMVDGGRVYISASGHGSELGDGYPDIDKSVTERFSFLAEDMQEEHSMEHKVCLYKEEDMTLLLESSGFTVKEVKSSSFGNIKAQAFKK